MICKTKMSENDLDEVEIKELENELEILKERIREMEKKLGY